MRYNKTIVKKNKLNNKSSDKMMKNNKMKMMIIKHKNIYKIHTKSTIVNKTVKLYIMR